MKKILKHPTFTPILHKIPTIKRLFFTLFGVLVLGFLFLSLLSYNPLDPAWSHVGAQEMVTNVGGRLGAWTADILCVFFGLGAWWLVLVMSYELALLWWRRTHMMWQLRMLAYGFLLACICALLVAWQATDGDKAMMVGGVLGFELYHRLVLLLNPMMTILFLLGFGVVVAILAFEVRLGYLFKKAINGAKTVEMNNHQNVVQAQDDAVILDVVKHQISSDDIQANMAQATQAQNSEDLSAFLTQSGLRDELMAQQNSAVATEQVAIRANEAVINVDNLVVQNTLNQEAVGASWQGSGDVASVNLTTSAKVDDLSLSDNELDDKIEVECGDTKKPLTIVTADIDETDDVDFVYQNHKTNQQVGINQEAVVGDALITISRSVQAMTDKEMPVSFVNLPQDDLVDDTKHQISADNENTDDKNIDEYSQNNPSHVAVRSQAMDTLSYRMSLSPIPELSLLDRPDLNKQPSYNQVELQQLSELLEIKLQEFNIKATVVSAMVGPVVTRFEVELAAGVKASRVTGAAQDLARSLSMASLRVVEVIPGKPYIGIEVPNKKREMVQLIELLDTPAYKDPTHQISVAIGKDIGGKVVIADLAKAPHMLVAGTTGSGKSVLVNSLLISMLLKYSPDELKLMLIDPKQLELANYGDIPHLLTPVITDMTEATAALTWCVTEMERRYQLMSLLRVRKISEFNKKIHEAEKRGQPILDPLWRADENVSIKTAPKLKPLPFIVIVADEFADMIMQLGKTAEEPIVRLAQKSRAAGIHLVLATQRPVATVVTGLIKANVPSRVALRVGSRVDSRIIIDESGAENMLGNGDMLFIGPGKNVPERVHGAYVDDDEVNRVCDAWRERGKPDYIDLSSSYTFEGEGSGDTATGGDDEYYPQAVAFVMETRKVSISSIQRKLGIGYNRAARIVDMMEERGLVSAMDNSGKRQLLM